MDQSSSDAALLAAVAGGERDAFEPLVGRHLRAVYRFVVRRIGPSDADDVVSETFELAFRNAGSYSAKNESARPWLLGIATNLLRRKAKREARMYRAYARTGVDPAAASENLAHDLHPALASALADLRREHRDALVLQALGELSCEEIAEVMRVPVGTVKGWLHRARTTVVQQLAGNELLAANHVSPTETRS
jgi:RNA polymerase sigma-70 factor, ECF subfamily